MTQNFLRVLRVRGKVGTIDYLSPEACQGLSPDERSDIWSFGVMLFELLTGQKPFNGANLTARLTAILTQPTPDLIQINQDIPDALADLVYRTPVCRILSRLGQTRRSSAGSLPGCSFIDSLVAVSPRLVVMTLEAPQQMTLFGELVEIQRGKRKKR